MYALKQKTLSLTRVFFIFFVLCHHNFRNDIKYFIVATAATRRTMRNSLHILEHF